MIDDKELARLEKLASAGYGGPFIDLTSLNNSEVRGAIPALVAEVRRLRERVEAWEWFEECFEVTQYLMANGKATPESRIVDVLSNNARVESLISTNFARERAVHADRE